MHALDDAGIFLSRNANGAEPRAAELVDLGLEVGSVFASAGRCRGCILRRAERLVPLAQARGLGLGALPLGDLALRGGPSLLGPAERGRDLQPRLLGALLGRCDAPGAVITSVVC